MSDVHQKRSQRKLKRKAIKAVGKMRNEPEFNKAFKEKRDAGKPLLKRSALSTRDKKKPPGKSKGR